MDWNKYYLDQAGGGNYNYYTGELYQKGYGLGGTFKRFFKWIVPLMRTHVAPAIKNYAIPKLESGLKTVGKEFLNSAVNVATDVVSGRELKETVQENAIKSINNLKEQIENNLKGCYHLKLASRQESRAVPGREKLLPGKTPVGKILSQISGQYFSGLFKDRDRISPGYFKDC